MPPAGVLRTRSVTGSHMVARRWSYLPWWRNLERLADLELLGIVDAVGRHQVFRLDFELLGDAGRVVAGFDDVRQLGSGRAGCGWRWLHHDDGRCRGRVGDGCGSARASGPGQA